MDLIYMSYDAWYDVSDWIFMAGIYIMLACGAYIALRVFLEWCEDTILPKLSPIIWQAFIFLALFLMFIIWCIEMLYPEHDNRVNRYNNCKYWGLSSQAEDCKESQASMNRILNPIIDKHFNDMHSFTESLISKIPYQTKVNEDEYRKFSFADLTSDDRLSYNFICPKEGVEIESEVNGPKVGEKIAIKAFLRYQEEDRDTGVSQGLIFGDLLPFSPNFPIDYENLNRFERELLESDLGDKKLCSRAWLCGAELFGRLNCGGFEGTREMFVLDSIKFQPITQKSYLDLLKESYK